MGPCHHGVANPQVADVETTSGYGRQMRIYGISSNGHPTRGGRPAWGFAEMLTTPHHKKITAVRNIPQVLGLGLIFCHETSSVIREASCCPLLTKYYSGDQITKKIGG